MEKQKTDWHLHTVYHVISDGTEEKMAKCVFKVVNGFELLDSVHALVFDTTNSNTGRWEGSSTTFETLLEQPCFGLHADIIYQSYLSIMQVSQSVEKQRVLMIHCSKNLKVPLVLLILLKEQSGNGQIASVIEDTVGLTKFYSGLTLHAESDLAKKELQRIV